jgi:hypothetical protein
VSEPRRPVAGTRLVIWPRKRAEWATFAVAAAIGLAIWIPTAAMQRRVSYDRLHPSQISSWYLPLMLVAALALGAIFARRWSVVAAGLLAPQIAPALWTTPQGDNDGLWMLIFPILGVVFAVVLLLAGISGGTVNYVRGRRNAGPTDSRAAHT